MFNKNISLLKKMKRKYIDAIYRELSEPFSALLVQEYVNIWNEKYPSGFPSKRTSVTVTSMGTTFF